MAAAGQPRADFLGDDLPRTARKSEEADQTRQRLALPVILDGGSRREAARTGGGGLQVIRDGTFAPWGSPWRSPSAPPARSTTHRTTRPARPARRSIKRLRRRRPHPQPMGRHADRELVQDDARMGQKNKRTRRRARRPRAPHDRRTEGACLFGALSSKNLNIKKDFC